MLKETLRRDLLAAGAVAVGFARAEEIDNGVVRQYAGWIAAGHHAGMDYLARHAVLKRHPRNVLEDVATVVSIAFSYAPAQWRSEDLPVIAAYAYGDDYHDVLRHRLAPVVDAMQREFGGSWRICIDSAPLAERWWALKSGIGRRGRNGSVIIDGAGSYVFLAEILTSHKLEPDINVDFRQAISSDIESEITSDIQQVTISDILSGSSSGKECMGCGACVKACPTGALGDDGTIDCRRCINYLTIEHRGEWAGEGSEAMQTEAGRRSLFGCDICQRVCPHNRSVTATAIKEFSPRKECIDAPEIILAMTQEEFSTVFKGSPIKRAKLAGLLRNASNLLRQEMGRY